MKQLGLFSKVIITVLFFGIIVFAIGFRYINTITEEAVNNQIEEKIESKIHHVFDYVRLEFRLLFYLYGQSSEDYKVQKVVSQKDVINNLKKHHENVSDVIYIVTPNMKYQISTKALESFNIEKILKNSYEKLEFDKTKYRVKTFYFKPWDWTIVYLLDTTNFEEILLRDKITLFIVVFFLLIVVISTLIVTFKVYIEKPIKALLKHFSMVTKGEYKSIDISFDSKEMDLLVFYVNKMTSSIKSREEDAIFLLKRANENEDYLEDMINSQESIIVVNDTVDIIKANNSFFELFSQYKNIEEFQKEHACICEFFTKEDGFIYNFEDKLWVDYLLENPEEFHKVKIKTNNIYRIYKIEAVKSKKYDRIILTMLDITELEKSTSLLLQYKKTVDAGAIVSKADLSGTITYANNKFVELTGYSEEELVGQPHNIIRSPRVPSETFKYMWKTIQSKKIWHGNLENIAKDGSPYYVSATIAPLLNANNDIEEYLALRFDITEQILAKEKAEKAEKAKSIFLANMSHEIRTPLNAIIGFTSILSKMTLPKKAAGYIKIVDQSATNLLGIVNDVLDISKIENNSLVFEKMEFNPYHEFEEIIDLFKIKAKEKEIHLGLFMEPSIPEKIIGDPFRVKQVISNLISNAIKFTNENGTVFVKIELIEREENSCKIKFSVTDNGIGISKDKQADVFKEFLQADDTISREFGGTGLGLSISSKIVKMLNSRIELESEIGKGSTFGFALEFDVIESSTLHLEKFQYIKVGIVALDSFNTFEYKLLKEYLSYMAYVAEIQKTDQLDKILKQDIVFVGESALDENIKHLENSNTKLVIVSQKDDEHKTFKNAVVLNSLNSSSVIFNILVDMVYQKPMDKENLQSNCQKFEGNILIAEDHDINQQLISVLLDLRGIEYTFANNGNEVIKLFKSSKYDLILMDINMPEKDGKEASIEILEIEKQRNLSHTPIVALSANAIEKDKNEILSIGIDDYLLKPINEKKLDEVFSQFLSKKDSSSNQDLKYLLEQSASSMDLDVNIVKKIVKSFCDTVDEDIDLLQDAIEKKDFEEIKNYAHKINGAALNLRMTHVSKYAQSIENQAHNQKNLSIKKDFEYLTKSIKAVKESIYS